MANTPHVLVAVTTFRRPRQLGILLPVLLDQIDDCEFPCSLVVIDNDPAATGAAVVSCYEERGARHVVEPFPGISAARNRALSVADHSDVIIFIDDDELPSKRWLQSLVDMWVERPCAAIAAPVLSQFESEPTAWISATGVFERPRWATGTVLNSARSGNLLLNMDFIRREALKFDLRFGLTGGEDTLLSRQIVRRGGQILWCDEAPVTELVDRTRSTRRWVLRRSFRAATTWSRIDLLMVEGRCSRGIRSCELIGRAVALAGIASLKLTIAVLIRNTALHARSLCRLATALGMATGALGYTFEEYRRR